MSTSGKIITAIVAMKKLEINYDDGTEIKKCIVLPHLMGKFKSTGNIVLSAWNDDESDGCWKSFLIDQIISVVVLDEVFEHTSKGYNPKDKRMSDIISCIKNI